MIIQITARHTAIPDGLRERAEEVVTRLGRLAHRPQRAEVVFDAAHQQQIVELQMHLPRGQYLVAKAEADDHRTALDRAAEKLRVQVEKESARLQQKVQAG